MLHVSDVDVYQQLSDSVSLWWPVVFKRNEYNVYYCGAKVTGLTKTMINDWFIIKLMCLLTEHKSNCLWGRCTEAKRQQDILAIHNADPDITHLQNVWCMCSGNHPIS